MFKFKMEHFIAVFTKRIQAIAVMSQRQMSTTCQLVRRFVSDGKLFLTEVTCIVY